MIKVFITSTISDSSIFISLKVCWVLGTNAGKVAFISSNLDIDTKKSFRTLAFSRSLNANISSSFSLLGF